VPEHVNVFLVPGFVAAASKRPALDRKPLGDPQAIVNERPDANPVVLDRISAPATGITTFPN